MKPKHKKEVKEFEASRGELPEVVISYGGLTISVKGYESAKQLREIAESIFEKHRPKILWAGLSENDIG